jgi:hypothetical protein
MNNLHRINTGIRAFLSNTPWQQSKRSTKRETNGDITTDTYSSSSQRSSGSQESERSLVVEKRGPALQDLKRVMLAEAEIQVIQLEMRTNRAQTTASFEMHRSHHEQGK